MSAASSAPAPEPGAGPEISPITPPPGPSAVPPRGPSKRRTALWGALLVLAALAGAAVLYLNNQPSSKVARKNGGIVTVPTVAVSLGGLTQTIRVSGTVTAQSFA